MGGTRCGAGIPRGSDWTSSGPRNATAPCSSWPTPLPTPGVALVFPQAIQIGSVAVERLEIQDLIEGDDVLEAEHAVAYLVVETRDEVRLYTSLAGSFLQIERVTAAAGMGTKGHAAGRLVLRVQGWALRDGPEGEQTGVSLGDTLTVHADFSTDVLEWGVGQATVTLTGGPAPLADVTREAWWVQQDSGPAGFGALEIEEGPPDIRVSLANPTVRNYALAPVNPAGGPARFPPSRCSGGVRPTPRATHRAAR